jgi:3-hydroxybutyryl-CoA dehydrogenase
MNDSVIKVINSVCIVGAGTAGASIAWRCARHGISVNLVDRSRRALEQAWRAFDRQVAGKAQASLDPQRFAEIRSRIAGTSDVAGGAARADLVIECVRESVAVKRKLFEVLDRVCPEHAILASNSSSVPISRLEGATGRLERVVNTHFFLPFAPVVELMSGTRTSQSTMQSVRRFVERIGMLAVLVRKERIGFALNRIWWSIKNECLRLVDEGVVTHEDIDRGWMALWKLSIGPFGLMDQIGLDTVRDIHVAYRRESGDSEFEAPAILLSKLDRGHLGAKTGRGFYAYPNPEYTRPAFLARSGQAANGKQ